MINLLSNDTQRQHRAARMNLKLRGYLVLLLATLIGVVVIFGGGYFLTLNERAVAKDQVAQNDQLTAQYAPVRERANTFASNLTIAKAILSQEVLYSDMISKIAATLPSSAILSSLALDQETFTEPVTFTARVVTKSDAIILKTTLENSPLFEDVNINSINEEEIVNTETNQTKISHPVIVTISTTFTKGVAGSFLP